MQDKCFTRIRKGLPCVDVNGVPPKKSATPPLPNKVGLLKLALKMANLEEGHKMLPPHQVFQPPLKTMDTGPLIPQIFNKG